MRGHRTIRAGGLALIVGAAAFLGVFAFLAARFDYPAVLDGNAAEVLPKLLATGATGRAVWAIYGLLPILWVPAGVAAFLIPLAEPGAYCRDSAPARITSTCLPMRSDSWAVVQPS